ncbi:S-adenosyl-L-methionine-dependent methyltransferase [Nemania sp. NC0429]|nr:S-adenosyl-L-methionine-dependent methyltransferase [Nemania sp. NC0429]
MSELYTTHMTRHSREAQRLEQQFNTITDNIGYLVHPSIRTLLPAAPRVIDVGTGTGVFLFRLREAYPDGVFEGIDISGDMFPATGAGGDSEVGRDNTRNIEFSVRDMKLPFPDEMLGRYDLVHARLLVVAMQPHEWEPAVRNLATLLKPGGFLQWEECDFLHTAYLRSGAAPTGCDVSHALQDAFREGLMERLAHGWSTLPSHMRASGLAPVMTDVVASDRLPDTRAQTTANAMNLTFSFAQLMAQRGAPGAKTAEELEDLEGKVRDEIQAGFYLSYNVHIACGQKGPK